MGSSASKTAQGTARKFPTRAPGTAAPPPLPRSTRPPPSQKPSPRASLTKDEAIRADSIDPQLPETMNPAFSDRLKQLGVAQPNPTYSPSSIASQMSGNQTSGSKFPSASKNPTLSALQARDRFQKEADEEFGNMGRSGSQGRQYLDIGTIRNILVMRERGASPEDIETRFNLRSGVVNRLGARGLVKPLGGAAP